MEPDMTGQVETWYADGFLYSAVIVESLVFPLPIATHPSDEVEVVELFITGGTERNRGGAQRVRYSVVVEFEALEENAYDLAAECLEQAADRLALLGPTRVEAELGIVTTAPRKATAGIYRAVSRGRRVVPEPESITTSRAQLSDVLSFFPIGRKAARALRWLRRSYMTDDLFLRFTSLAVALEALASQVSVPAGTEKGPSTSERLALFATTKCEVSPGVWQRVGRLRNDLFHGGLADTEDAREDVDFAAAWSEYVLVCGLREVLGSAPHQPPFPQRPPDGTLSNVRITVEGSPEELRRLCP